MFCLPAVHLKQLCPDQDFDTVIEAYRATKEKDVAKRKGISRHEGKEDAGRDTTLSGSGIDDDISFIPSFEALVKQETHAVQQELEAEVNSLLVETSAATAAATLGATTADVTVPVNAESSNTRDPHQPQGSSKPQTHASLDPQRAEELLKGYLAEDYAALMLPLKTSGQKGSRDNTKLSRTSISALVLPLVLPPTCSLLRCSQAHISAVPEQQKESLAEFDRQRSTSPTHSAGVQGHEREDSSLATNDKSVAAAPVPSTPG